MCRRQMSGWDGNVHGGQITSQPVPGMSSQEMPPDGHEQRRSVQYSRLIKEMTINPGSADRRTNNENACRKSKRVAENRLGLE